MNLKEYRHKDVTYKEGSLSIILSAWWGYDWFLSKTSDQDNAGWRGKSEKVEEHNRRNQ